MEHIQNVLGMKYTEKNYNSTTGSTIYTYNPESYGKNQNGLWTTRRILKILGEKYT